MDRLNGTLSKEHSEEPQTDMEEVSFIGNRKTTTHYEMDRQIQEG